LIPEVFKGVWIPRAVFVIDDLTLHQKIVVSMVINLTSDEPCYATNHYIGEILGIHPTRVSVHLNNLKKMGYLDIKIVRNKDKHITKRLITPTPALRNRIGGLSETANQPISETAKGIIKKDNKEDNKHISESNRLIKDREKEDFKKFWFTIPELRRINKPLTLKHWKEATHKESVETIQNAMELFVQRVEPQFIKTSYNWLKQEYWKSIPPAQEKVRKGFEYV
jgi:DNA-binding MarR family transcriptional regulator